MFDTSIEITRKVCEMFQKKTAIERLKMGCSMYETSRYLITRAILETEPNISKKDLNKKIFLKFYGDDFDPITLEKIIRHLSLI